MGEICEYHIIFFPPTWQSTRGVTVGNKCRHHHMKYSSSFFQVSEYITSCHSSGAWHPFLSNCCQADIRTRLQAQISHGDSNQVMHQSLQPTVLVSSPSLTTYILSIFSGS